MNDLEANVWGISALQEDDYFILNICDYHGAETPDWLAEEISRGDKIASISKAAGNNRCPICAETFTLFVHLYGTEAGNQAL